MQSGTHEPDCLRRRSYNTGLHLVSSASDPRRLAGVVHRDVLRVLGKPRYVHTCDNVTKMGAGPEMTVSRRRTYSYGSALIGFPTWNPFESDQFMEGDFSSTELGARRKPAACARIFTYDMAILRHLSAPTSLHARNERAVQLYCSRSTFAGSTRRARRTGPATDSEPVSSMVNATAAMTNGSCAVA